MGLQPQRTSTPRTGVEDAIAALFNQSLQQAGAPSVTSTGKGGNKVTGGGTSLQDIFANLSLPSYTGGLTAPTTDIQTQALNAAQGGLSALPGYADLGSQVAGGLMGVAGGGGGYAPPSLQDLLTNRPGTDILTQLTQGGGPGGSTLQRLLQPQNYGQDLLTSVAKATPDFSGITDLLGGQGASPLSRFLNVQTPERTALNPMAGGGPDFAGILDALDQARQSSLARDLGNIREQFSASGLRNSTNLADVLGQTAETSRQSFLGQAAQLLPQLAAQKQSALSTAGQLGLGGAGLGVQAAQGLAGQGTSLAQTLAQLNLGARGQTGDILSQLANIGLQGTGQQANAANILQQLGLSAGTGLQTGGLQAGDILAQLYQGQQGRGLSALQSLPGAAQLFANLPGQVATGAYGLGTQEQQQATQALQAQLQEFIRTQGALFAPILNFAAGAPQITGPGKGSQILGTLATVGAAAAGKS